MVKTNDDRPDFPDEIPASSKKAKHCFLLQPCRISSVHLSEELLYEVFLRLPVKSLIRFRSVSKGMRGLIDSSIFIKNHNIHRSVISERARSLSVDSYSDDDEEYAVLLRRLDRFFSLNFDNDDNNNNNLNRGKAIELNAKEGMFLMGWCCNGIFCFQNSVAPDTERYVFWNPSNGTFRKVDCSSCLPSVNDSMGYDSVNKDYKIISFIEGNNNEAGVQVYSLRKDSWRKLLFHRDFPSGWTSCGRKAVCVSGVMHWLWTNGNTVKSIFIAAFNLATETFTSLPLPSEARQLQLQLQPRHFTDFRGRLCITFLPPRRIDGPHTITFLPPGRIDGTHTIWVMEKYGVESSWSKLYNFNIDRAHNVPNFYFPNIRGRLLCYIRQLCWWDPQDGYFERIEIPGLLNACALVYVRNLVRLDHSLV